MEAWLDDDELVTSSLKEDMADMVVSGQEQAVCVAGEHAASRFHKLTQTGPKSLPPQGLVALLLWYR